MSQSEPASRDWVEARLSEIMRIIETDRLHHNQMMAVHQQAHQNEHKMSEAMLDKSEVSMQRTIDELRASLDRLEEARATFISRERHEAELEIIRNRIDAFERESRTERARIERELRTEMEKDSESVTSVITELKTKLAEVNARFQQSIVALGILLTIIEFFLRR